MTKEQARTAFWDISRDIVKIVLEEEAKQFEAQAEQYDNLANTIDNDYLSNWARNKAATLRSVAQTLLEDADSVEKFIGKAN